MEAHQTQGAGLIDTLKNKFNPSTIAQEWNLTQERLLEILLYLGVGFLSGYILKKYSKVISILILGLILLIIAQQFELISVTVYWNKIQTMLGFQPLEPLEGSLVSAYWEWTKQHIALVVSFSIGFLFGVRLG